MGIFRKSKKLSVFKGTSKAMQVYFQKYYPMPCGAPHRAVVPRGSTHIRC
jgi:hypothetical protein